ncbi:glycosyltransferase family 2 protein [Spirosoma daeguense]
MQPYNEQKKNAINQIAGAVILYNSDLNVCDNIRTYINQIDILYVIDNSEFANDELIRKLREFKTVKYISNGGNKGIAHALNLAATVAINDRYSYLLTMDDDAQLPLDAVEKMANHLSNSTYPERIGIISGVHSEDLVANIPFRKVLFTMTSGNLLTLAAYQKVGPFRDDFFIDHVDHEYGLRLNSADFDVIELPTLYLNHRLGKRMDTGFFHKTFTSHTPQRSYYIVRNGWMLVTLYKNSFPIIKGLVINWIVREWMRAIFFEDQKFRRIRLLWRGIKDALQNQLGQLVEKR